MAERTQAKYLNLAILAFAMAQAGYKWYRDATGPDTPGGKRIKAVEIPGIARFLADGLYQSMGIPIKVTVIPQNGQEDIVVSIFGVLLWMGTFIMAVRDWSEKAVKPESDGGANISTKEIDELAMITATSLHTCFGMDTNIGFSID